MPAFRILYLHDSVLEHVETVHARDILEAIESASVSGRPDCTAEIWSEKGKVGIIGPSPLSSPAGVH